MPRVIAVPLEVYPLIEECMIPYEMVEKAIAKATISRQVPPPSPSDRQTTECNPGFLDSKRAESLLTKSAYILKPNIVFFGERLPASFSQAIDLDSRIADLLLVMGSSLRVRPVSGVLGMLPHYVPQIFVNRPASVPGRSLSHQFDAEFRGDCDDFARWLGHAMGWNLFLSSTTEENLPRYIPRLDNLRIDSSPKTNYRFFLQHNPGRAMSSGHAYRGKSEAAMMPEEQCVAALGKKD